MSSSLVSIRSLLGLSRARSPPFLLHRPPRVFQIPPYLRCQLRLAPHSLLRRNFAATCWVQYVRPTPVVQSGPEPKEQTNVSTSPRERPTIRENIYTIPNLLTASRILACPVLGWSIFHDDFYLATGLLVYAGLSDLLDGFLARRFNMHSVLGSILDPAADKALMTTLTVTLALKSMLPLWLATIIIGRDALLSLSAFYIRYTSLPPPKTWRRYWDFSIPSAEVRPTTISKVCTFSSVCHVGCVLYDFLLLVQHSCAACVDVRHDRRPDWPGISRRVSSRDAGPSCRDYRLEWFFLCILKGRGSGYLGDAQGATASISIFVVTPLHSLPSGFSTEMIIIHNT
ncbi:CDP-alcohol phosphatidyltransferase-domain-containing protein [Boletus coccyginus]|nr:CDP-alcohol phosphatidyltransferase-domain-containing protein [Boletus coccyginus]